MLSAVDRNSTKVDGEIIGVLERTVFCSRQQLSYMFWIIETVLSSIEIIVTKRSLLFKVFGKGKQKETKHLPTILRQFKLPYRNPCNINLLITCSVYH